MNKVTEIKFIMKPTEDGYKSDNKIPAGFTIEDYRYGFEDGHLVITMKGEEMTYMNKEDLSSQVPHLSREPEEVATQVGSNPTPGNTLEPYEKRHYRACRDELDAINALIYFAGVKGSEGFGCTKDGYRVEIRKVEG